MTLTRYEIADLVRLDMLANGIELRDPLEADGAFHRARLVSDKGGEKTAWYVIHTNEPIRAVYGCNNRGNDWKVIWRPEGQAPLSQAAQKRLAREVADARRQRERAQAKRRDSAAAKARFILGNKVSDEPGDHAYLVKKGMPGCTGHGLFRQGDALVVPVCDINDVVHSLQFISPEGEKRFLTDGAIAGHFHRIGQVEGDTWVICEGLATGLSLRAATGLTVIVAFDAVNLLPVAQVLRKTYRRLRLIVAADNDQFTAVGNTGLTKAREVAAQVKNVVVVYPEFAVEELTTKPTDFNDLATLRGLPAVKLALEPVLNPAMTKPPATPKKPRTGEADRSANESSSNSSKVKAPDRDVLPIAGGEIRYLDDGLYYIGQGTDGDPLPPMKICSDLRVTATTRNSDGAEWGRLLEWRDPDGTPHTWALPMEMLAGDGVEVRAELLRGGVFISPGKKARDILGIFLQVWPAPDRALCTSITGWHGRAFVLPNETIGGQGERVVFQSTAAQGHAFRARGDLEDWIKHVAQPCLGNSRLMLVLCAALAAPLLHIAELEGGGIHLVGPSSIGKTVALQVARSVFAAPEGLHRWRTTTNGLEATAVGHNGLPLPLDELSQLESKEASDVGYSLSNGVEKVRATRTGSARPRRTWRLIFISSGEVTLSDRAAEAGRRVNAGAEVRVLNIPARVGFHGLFNVLPDEYHGNAAEFARCLSEATLANYGTAGPAFVRYLLEHYDDLPDMLRAAERAFLGNMVGKDADGQVWRAARRFALFAAAGELAAVAGILPWPSGKATQAMEQCFRDWVDQRGGKGSAEDRESIAQVRRVLESGREARFSAWSRADDDHAPRTQDMYGYWRTDSATNGELHFYIQAERFRTDVCKGFDARAVAKRLKLAGYLVSDDGRYTFNTRLPGRSETERFYVVRAAIFEGPDDEH